MITNILLGLILGVVITGFIILNNKINKIDEYVRETLSNTNFISANVDRNHKIISIILDRFNNKVLKDDENYFNIITLLKSRFKDVDDATDSIYDKLNTIDTDTTTLIIGEHTRTRDAIKKQAKISSKKKSNSKTNKAITHTRKCE